MYLSERIETLPLSRFHYRLLLASGIGWAFDSMDVGIGTAGTLLTWGSLMSFFNLGAWGVVYTYTPELYPTRVRASGSGCSASCSSSAPSMSGSWGSRPPAGRWTKSRRSLELEAFLGGSPWKGGIIRNSLGKFLPRPRIISGGMQVWSKQAISAGPSRTLSAR